MRTDPAEDPVAAAHRRLDVFGRFWAERDGTEPPAALAALAAPAGEPAELPGSRSPWSVPVGIRPGQVVLVVVLGVATVLFALWWTARSAPQSVPLADTSPAAAPVAGASPPATVGTTSSPSPSPTGAVVVVDVAGKVRRPQVITLPAGSRVIDAIRKAGGARRGIDLSGINLARVLVDGEQVLVGGSGRRPPAAASSGGAATSGGVVNLNSASAAQLEELPGVGPVTAQKIVAWREANGAFTSAEDLLEIDGIGPKTLADLAPAVTW